MIVSIKEVMLLLDCSEKTAINHLKTIKAKYKIDIVTKWHLLDYLSLDWYALEISWQIRIKQDHDKAMEILKLRNKYHLDIFGIFLLFMESFYTFL